MTPTRIAFAAAAALVAIGLTTPAQAGFQVIGSLTREMQGEPGARQTGRILVHNTGTEVIELEAAQTDYWFSADGTNRYDKAGSQPRSNAKWLHVSPQQLRVPAGETLTFSYELAIPNDPALTGSYWSMIMISPILQPDGSEATTRERPVTVQTKMRYAVQMVTEVGAPGSASIRVNNARLAHDEGDIRLLLDIENTGIRHTRPRIYLEVFDSVGSSVGRWPADERRIYPGTSTRFTVPLTGLPSGSYSALMVADLGHDEILGVQYSLDIP